MKTHISIILILAILQLSSVYGQTPKVEVFATGLVNPIGITLDASGNLWVAEQGTGKNDSRISIVTPNGQVYPFLTGLPSGTPGFEPIGAEDVFFDIDGKLLILQGSGDDSLSNTVLIVDPRGFKPGDPPLTRAAIQSRIRIGSLGAGSNPYRIELGPGDDWYIVDAAANKVFVRDRITGVLRNFTNFSPIGQSEAVPTGIVFTGDKFIVGTLTGLPIPIGAARLYQVDLSGNIISYQSGFTAIVDVAIDPRDSQLVVLQHAHFGPPWLNNLGALLKVHNGVIDTLLYGLNRPTGMVFNSSGELFITTFADDNILKVTDIPITTTDVPTNEHSLPTGFELSQNYPNPFNPTTVIRYTIPSSSFVSLKVFDMLGKEVANLMSEEQSSGVHSVEFDANGLASGIYFYQLKAGNFAVTKKMLIQK
ncbi:MAG: ScyD/ScyE family protein [candidate division KSB1 bacterium]|nr:ScyD/ScyE family protein [candidate division KSB1 bacterium]